MPPGSGQTFGSACDTGLLLVHEAAESQGLCRARVEPCVEQRLYCGQTLAPAATAHVVDDGDSPGREPGAKLRLVHAEKAEDALQTGRVGVVADNEDVCRELWRELVGEGELERPLVESGVAKRPQ